MLAIFDLVGAFVKFGITMSHFQNVKTNVPLNLKAVAYIILSPLKIETCYSTSD